MLVSRANSPKGGDAKPPVYGTQVPMTAGLPGRTLTHSARSYQACAPRVRPVATHLPPSRSRWPNRPLRGDSWTWRCTIHHSRLPDTTLVRQVALPKVPLLTARFCVSGLTFYLTLHCYIVPTALRRGQRFQA